MLHVALIQSVFYFAMWSVSSSGARIWHTSWAVLSWKGQVRVATATVLTWRKSKMTNEITHFHHMVFDFHDWQNMWLVIDGNHSVSVSVLTSQNTRGVENPEPACPCVNLFPHRKDHSNLLALISKLPRLLQSALLWATSEKSTDWTWANRPPLQPRRSLPPLI